MQAFTFTAIQEQGQALIRQKHQSLVHGVGRTAEGQPVTKRRLSLPVLATRPTSPVWQRIAGWLADLREKW